MIAGAERSIVGRSSVRDVAGQGATIPDDEVIGSYTVADFTAYLGNGADWRIYLKIDNLFDETYAVSRRPFGLRPGKPRQWMVGFKHAFGGGEVS